MEPPRQANCLAHGSVSVDTRTALSAGLDKSGGSQSTRQTPR
ncbi:hypothetical protein [Spirosoma fluviale]|nr:hypothetical protein [Spirosoma fluviale]